MSYVNHYDKNGECSKNGNAAEDEFLEILKNKKGIHNVRRADKYENIYDHIDHKFTTSDGKVIRIDTKAMKKVSRSDKKANTDLVWIEFQNVAGKKGWLYGKADLISFERENDFVLVSRKKLLELCEKLVNKKNKVDNAYEALYNSYTRIGRKDIVSQIKMDDVLNNTQPIFLKKIVFFKD